MCKDEPRLSQRGLRKAARKEEGVEGDLRSCASSPLSAARLPVRPFAKMLINPSQRRFRLEHFPSIATYCADFEFLR